MAADFIIKINTKTLKQFLSPSENAGKDDYAVYNAYGKRVVRYQLFEQDMITARPIAAGTAFQFSLTQPTDWNLTTAPLIRINDDLFTVIDAANGIIEADVLTSSGAFNTYVQDAIDPSIGGTTGGAQELVEYLVTNSDSDILNGAINAAVTSFIATDDTKYTVGDKITFLDTPETLIVTAIDSGTSEITFQGAGVDGVSLFSHINGATIDIKTVKETPLLQHPCTFAGRRDLGGQTICSEGGDSPPSYSEVAALISIKVSRDLSEYDEQSSLQDTDNIYTRSGALSKWFSIATLKALMQSSLNFLSKNFSTYPSKTTPVNADTFIINNSADTFAPAEVSWQNIRNTLSTLYQNIDFNDFDIENIAAIGFKDGEAMTWNADDFCVDIPTGLGPVLQTGQELYVIIYNGTGSQIDNGSPVYSVGAFGTRPSMAPANSTTHVKITGAVLLTTMDIPNGQFGIASSFGRARGINTTAIGSSGNTVWVKAGAIDGLLTVDKPAFPNYVIQIGGIAVEDAVDGVIQIDIKGTPEDTITNFFNGTFRETFDFTVSESGGVVTGSLSPANGHDDMTMNFSDGFTMLTTTPAATIILTAGTDENPQTNFVYILQSAKVLALSTAGWPTAEHIKVAKLEIQSAAQTQTDGGALRNQNINDAIENTDTNQGHLTHITSAIREKVPAKILSGIEGTCTTDGTDVFIAVTAGIVKQMHNQSIPAIDTAVSDFVKIKNNFASPLAPVQNLNGQTLDSQGNTLDNTSFSFVLWEIGNKSGEPSFGMINLPSDSYAFNSPDSAVNDALNYADYSIPDIYFGVAVLVARFTYTYKAGAWVLYATESLRGQVPNTSAGGGGGGGAGVSTWLALLDTPSSFAGQAGLIPIVNVGESALEFGAVGSGDVVGPVSSTDNAIVRYDSTTGKLIQNSLITITDAGKLSFPDIVTTGVINTTARSVAPTAPATNDIYLDDGSNSSSGGLAWRKYNGSTWDDIGVGSGVSDTFVYGDLPAGVLSVTHSFGLWYPSAIAMWNTTTGELYSPPADTITTTNNNIDIDMSSFGVFANTFLYNFGSATSNGSPITNFTNYGNYYSANSLPLDYDETLWSVSTRPIIDYDIIGAPLMRFDYATAEYAGAFVLDEIPADSTNLATRVKVRPFSTGATGTNMGWTIKYIIIRDNVATTSIATQILGSTVFETSGAGDTTDTYEIALSTLGAQAGDTIICILYPDTTVATPKQTDWMLLSVNMGVS